VTAVYINGAGEHDSSFAGASELSPLQPGRSPAVGRA
jgi:hypothetical protein